MLAGHLLLAPRFVQGQRHLRIFQQPLQMLGDHLGGFFQRQVADLHLAVGRAQVQHPAGLDQKQPADRLIGAGPFHLHRQHIQRLNLKRRLGNHPQGIDQQDIRRLDRIRRQRDHVLFTGNVVRASPHGLSRHRAQTSPGPAAAGQRQKRQTNNQPGPASERRRLLVLAQIVSRGSSHILQTPHFINPVALQSRIRPLPASEISAQTLSLE